MNACRNFISPTTSTKVSMRQQSKAANKTWKIILCTIVFLAIISVFSVEAQEDNNNHNDDEYKDGEASQDELLDTRTPTTQKLYDPFFRDFTKRCMKLAQYSGAKACFVFNSCCSEENVLNKLNGDKCQKADPTNGCTPTFSGDGVQWSQCRAYNCTMEITTTTTTTRAPRRSAAASMANGLNGLKLLGKFINFAVFFITFDKLSKCVTT